MSRCTSSYSRVPGIGRRGQPQNLASRIVLKVHLRWRTKDFVCARSHRPHRSPHWDSQSPFSSIFLLRSPASYIDQIIIDSAKATIDTTRIKRLIRIRPNALIPQKISRNETDLAIDIDPASISSRQLEVHDMYRLNISFVNMTNIDRGRP